MSQIVTVVCGLLVIYSCKDFYLTWNGWEGRVLFWSPLAYFLIFWCLQKEIKKGQRVCKAVGEFYGVLAILLVFVFCCASG